MYKCICNDRQILLNTAVLSLFYDYLFSYFVVFSGFKKPKLSTHLEKCQQSPFEEELPKNLRILENGSFIKSPNTGILECECY